MSDLLGTALAIGLSLVVFFKIAALEFDVHFAIHSA